MMGPRSIRIHAASCKKSSQAFPTENQYLGGLRLNIFMIKTILFNEARAPDMADQTKGSFLC